MLLLVAASALAAPLAPSRLDGAGVQVSALLGAGHAALSEDGCATQSCEAWREGVPLGGEVAASLGPVAVYAHASWVRETIAAALYTGEGYALGGGLMAALSFGERLGLHTWAGVDHQLTGDATLTERASAWQLDVGVALRGGSLDDGLQGWIGVGATPWTDIEATVLNGDLALALRPAVPLEAVAGAQLASEPLAGPWNARGRLAAGLRGTVGYRTELVGFVSLLY